MAVTLSLNDELKCQCEIARKQPRRVRTETARLRGACGGDRNRNTIEGMG